MVWKTRSTVSVLVAVAAMCAVIPVVAPGGSTGKANSTLFGPNVFVFDPKMPAADIQKTANDIFKKMEANEFGSERRALLFKPGKYDVTFNVGFYTHVAGLGRNPDDVHINGGVNVTADWKPTVPPAPTLGAAAKKAAAQPEARGPGVPHHPDKPPADRPSLAAFLRRVLFEIPPGRPEAASAEAGTQRLKPLPARRAKLELVEMMRDLALDDADFAGGVLPLLEEFMTSRGTSERAACLVAVTRIRHTHPGLRTSGEDGEGRR